VVHRDCKDWIEENYAGFIFILYDDNNKGILEQACVVELDTVTSQ